jgi:hypothetical protein
MAVDLIAPGAKEIRFKQALWPLTENKALSRTVDLPASPTDGDVYIVRETHPTLANQIAFRYFGAWEYVVPELGWKCFIEDDIEDVWFDGEGWIPKDIQEFVGDTGLGGISGLVPAPAAGDADLGAYLHAGGSFLPVNALVVTYDNVLSGLASDTVQDAIDELAAGGGGGGGTAASISFDDSPTALVDGANVQAALVDVDAHIAKTRIAFYIGGAALTASEELFVYIVKKVFSLPAGLTGSGVKAGVAATGTTVVDIKKNGSNIGTATWSAAGTTATLALASTTAFAVDDTLSLVGPATADTTLARIYGTLVGDYT